MNELVEAHKRMAQHYDDAIQELQRQYQGVRPSWVSAEIGMLMSSRDQHLSLAALSSKWTTLEGNT